MMTREEFNNIKKGDKIWKYRDGSPLDGYLVCRVERICNGDPVVYIRGGQYTYEDLCDNFRVGLPKEKTEKLWKIEKDGKVEGVYQISKEGLERVEDEPKGLDLLSFSAKDVLSKDKYTIAKNGLITTKTKTMKKKKVAKGHVYNPNPSKVASIAVLVHFYGLVDSLCIIEGVGRLSKWDILDILLQLGLAEDKAGLRKAAKVAGVKYKKAKKYLSQF